jgi:IS30 family transposase
MTLTQEQIKQIKKLRKEGKSTYAIAKIFNVNQSTICYHTMHNTKKKQTYASRKDYLRDYARDKYKNNPEFREKQKERCRINKEKKK